jgi:hypothetical protein
VVKALEERPDVESEFVWLWNAFNRLSTTRQNGLGTGEISFMNVLEYCREYGYSTDEREFLWDVIKTLDSLFRKRLAEKSKRTTTRR